ncbi:hypothetical protein CASFOL_001141 [Castilleja foliolosa]|uniref:Uncharacterized protein n=1 Tax=Castilleja foliolosa TaxID=1961234 RepID=A0ABD3EM93_9LAMI
MIWCGTVAEAKDEDAGQTINYRVGQEFLDRLAIALGGNTTCEVAAISAIGQLSTDLSPDLQVEYHQRVLSALAMDDF